MARLQLPFKILPCIDLTTRAPVHCLRMQPLHTHLVLKAQLNPAGLESSVSAFSVWTFTVALLQAYGNLHTVKFCPHAEITRI